MDFINSLFGMGTTSVVLLGAFFIAFIGYALGSIQVKGVSLGTAGVFLMALLMYLLSTPVQVFAMARPAKYPHSVEVLHRGQRIHCRHKL